MCIYIYMYICIIMYWVCHIVLFFLWTTSLCAARRGAWRFAPLAHHSAPQSLGQTITSHFWMQNIELFIHTDHIEVNV